MKDIVEVARAKINLALHVTGQRSDGYHLIDSLVTFADFGDVLTFSDATSDRLTIYGAFAANLENDGDNLVVRARDALRAHAVDKGHEAGPVAIRLEKNLPVASGVGGGSADAAATLRGLSRYWDLPKGSIDSAAVAATLGADVPMCLVSVPLIARGIGDALAPATTLPSVSLLLVNPLEEISTTEVFGALADKNNAPLTLDRIPDNLDTLVAVLKNARNDLEKPAETLTPLLGVVRKALQYHHPEIVRMSGSGATFFGIFRDLQAAQFAAEALNASYPHWYIHACTTRSIAP
ncbi:MAG: 4-(cytidine 5'-diphospho)-2-C-methyl-D-erythritol kinase [Rhizobiaceae bacterium]|nr:4-(cytidine 5'-diphospho)-2-C-methyl-D-erythritol kinase [Rhizobiaceae bacterium]